MGIMENFQDIFNLDSQDFVEKTTSKESDLYKPNAKDGKDNTYKALIRFIPFWKDPKKSKIKKFSYWLEDPLTGDGFSVDCPSTINQKSVLQDTFWKLKKSQSVAEQKLSDKFKRRENYYALIQILKDDQRPEMVGKIKILKFGQKLNAIIQSELQPEYGQPYNPFDLIKGRPMALHVTLNAGFNNYDLSKFIGDAFPAIMNSKQIEGTQESMRAFFEHLKTASPDLSMYDYREWDDDTHSKVKSIIENTVPSMRTSENIARESASASRTSRPSVDIDLTPSTVDEKPFDINNINFDGLEEGGDFEKDLYAGL